MSKARKNSYRLTFSIGDQRAQFTSHTQAEATSIRLHVKRLICSKRTGAPCLESEEWAATRPKGALRDFLIKWGLLEGDNTQKTVADLAEAFKKRHVKEWTLKSYQGLINNFLDFFGADYPLSKIDKKKAGEFITFLETSANRKTGRGLGKVSVSKRIERSRQFFNYCVNEGWILRNPFSGYRGTGSANPDRWQYITKEDTVQVIEATTNKKHKVIIALLRFCGLRGASELSRLTFDSSCFHPSTAETPAELVVHSPKVEAHAGRETRTIPLTKYVEQLILDLWESTPEEENRFFPDMKPTSNPGVVIKKTFKRFGVSLGSPYNLRRSYVSDLMAGGLHEADPKAFELLAGHSVRMSLQHYQVFSDRRKEKATEKFLEIMETSDAEKASTQFGTHQVHNLVHRSNSQQLTVYNNNNGMSLEITDCFKKQKTPCEKLQGALMWEAGLEPA